MAIIRQIPWTEQPQDAVGVDWGNPLSAGLLSAVDGRLLRDVVAGNFPTSNSTTPAAALPGIGAEYTSKNAQFDFTARGKITNQVTYFALLDYDNTAAPNSFLFGDVQAAGAGYNSGLYSNGSVFSFFVKTGGAGTSASGGTIHPLRRVVAIAGRYNGANLHVFVNGRQDGTTAKTGNVDTGSFSLNINRWNSASLHRGAFFAGFVWNRALSDTEIAEVSANPWQLFAPRVQRIWAPVASGPVTHATDGALVGAGSIAAGAAARFRALSTSGALTGQIGSVAGFAARAGGAVSHDNTGALIGGASVISGSAARVAGFVTHATIGNLAGAGASLAGTAARVAGAVSHATSGSLVGGTAQIAGTAARLGLPVTHATTGALAGPGALLVGSAFPTPSLVLLGGGPGGPKKDASKYREKGSAWERLLSPPLRERVRQLEEQEPEAIELIEAKAVAEVARPAQGQAQDGAAEIQRVMEQAGLAYQDAYREIYTELLAEMLQQQEDEAVAMAVASLV